MERFVGKEVWWWLQRKLLCWVSRVTWARGLIWKSVLDVASWRHPVSYALSDQVSILTTDIMAWLRPVETDRGAQMSMNFADTWVHPKHWMQAKMSFSGVSESFPWLVDAVNEGFHFVLMSDIMNYLTRAEIQRVGDFVRPGWVLTVFNDPMVGDDTKHMTTNQERIWGTNQLLEVLWERFECIESLRWEEVGDESHRPLGAHNSTRVAAEFYGKGSIPRIYSSTNFVGTLRRIA